MKPAMDVARNHRMDWFFAEWVFGTEVPSYRMEYKIAPTEVAIKLTQSGVGPNFAMPVPVYGDFHGKMRRLGTVGMIGNASGEFKIPVPEAPKRVLLNLNHDILTDKEEVKKM
jgi:hypothetical protein